MCNVLTYPSPYSDICTAFYCIYLLFCSNAQINNNGLFSQTGMVYHCKLSPFFHVNILTLCVKYFVLYYLGIKL